MHTILIALKWATFIILKWGILIWIISGIIGWLLTGYNMKHGNGRKHDPEPDKRKWSDPKQKILLLIISLVLGPLNLFLQLVVYFGGK
jgi:hypothetical protein